MTEKLKPCPFCGESDVRPHFQDSGVSWVQCEDCGAAIGCSYGVACDRHSVEELAEKWNTRHLSPADLSEEVEALKNKIDELKTAIKILGMNKGDSKTSCGLISGADGIVGVWWDGTCASLMVNLPVEAEPAGVIML